MLLHVHGAVEIQELQSRGWEEESTNRTYRKRLASSIKGRFSSSVSSFHSAPAIEINETCFSLQIFNVRKVVNPLDTFRLGHLKPLY